MADVYYRISGTEVSSNNRHKKSDTVTYVSGHVYSGSGLAEPLQQAAHCWRQAVVILIAQAQPTQRPAIL